jgi:hypothetical protein
VRRLAAFTLFLSACADASAYPTAAPALVRTVPVEDAIVLIAPVQEPLIGVITFGTAYDPETLAIPKPLTRFKRTYPVIAWSATLSRGVKAAFVSWTVLRRTDSGDEEVMFDVEEPIDDSTLMTLANAGSLTFHVDYVPGTYVMRYIDSTEVLAEGIFTLVK